VCVCVCVGELVYVCVGVYHQDTLPTPMWACSCAFGEKACGGAREANIQSSHTTRVPQIEECTKFGQVVACIIPRPHPPSEPVTPADEHIVKIFVAFKDAASASIAKEKLHGRKFDGKSVVAKVCACVRMSHHGRACVSAGRETDVRPSHRGSVDACFRVLCPLLAHPVPTHAIETLGSRVRICIFACSFSYQKISPSWTPHTCRPRLPRLTQPPGRLLQRMPRLTQPPPRRKLPPRRVARVGREVALMVLAMPRCKKRPFSRRGLLPEYGSEVDRATSGRGRSTSDALR
jgi:hypothetical protein